MLFRKFANYIAHLSGTPWAFMFAALLIVCWAVTGPIFHFSDTWQLVINTGTTIVTFLMVFLIQNTQNRDTQALHAKLDELVINLRGADNHLVKAEELSDEELQELKEKYRELADTAATEQSEPRSEREPILEADEAAHIKPAGSPHATTLHRARYKMRRRAKPPAASR